MVLECVEHPGKLHGGACDSAKVKDPVSHLLFEYFIGERSVGAPASLCRQESDRFSHEGGEHPRT